MRSILNFFFVSILFVCCHLDAFANLSPHQQAIRGLTEQLTVDKQQQLAFIEKQKQLQRAALPSLIAKNAVDKAQLILAECQADLSNALLIHVDIQHHYNELKLNLNEQFDKLQEARVQAIDNPKKEMDLNLLQAQLNYLSALTDLEQQRLGLWQTNVTLLQKIVKLASDQYQATVRLFYQKQSNDHEQELVQMAASVQAKREQLLRKMSDLNRQMEKFPPDARYSNPQAIQLSFEQYETNEEIFLAELGLRLQRFNDQMRDLADVEDKHLPIAQLDAELRQSSMIKLNMQNSATGIKAKLQLLSDKKKILDQSLRQDILSHSIFEQQSTVLLQLQNRYSHYLSSIEANQKSLSKNQLKIQRELTYSLAQRQNFPGLDRDAWHILLQKALHIPAAMSSLVLSFKEHVILSMELLPDASYFLIGGVEVILLIIASILRSYITLAISLIPANRKTISSNMAYAFLQLLRRNLLSLTLMTMLFCFLFMVGVPVKSYRFIIYLAAVWLAYRMLMGLARMCLLETTHDISGEDVALYRRLQWILSIGALIAASSFLIQELNIAYEVRDFINRLAMLFILSFSITLFNSRQVFPRLIDGHLEYQHRYLQMAVVWVSWLVPISLFLNALIGLIGYMQLAWVMSFYQALIVLFVSSFIILRGFVIDFMEWLADNAVLHLENGWIWRQAFLKPLERIVRILMVVGLLALLIALVGAQLHTPLLSRFQGWMGREIIRFPHNAGTITWNGLLLFSILSAVLVWMGKWMREISYRLFYGNLRDQSLQNSLAIFTQYLSVILGMLFTLRVLGLDVSGLSYILGGLAVGFGLGLRDFANNIVSGIMLLIERPVREGDLISVGEFEGNVTQIGLRSMTVRSWDHLEVLIPNSELFNKTFTNWTRQDSIVRTVIPIKIQHDDNPNRIQQLLLGILLSVDAILVEPPPQVFLREISESLMELDVRYFINLEHHLRVEVRSDVLLKIWATFENEGIKRPYPQQDLHII